MSIIISEKGGERRDFKPVPAGTHLAVCTMLIDVGLQPGFENGPPQRKVYIGFEVPAERVEFTDKNGDKVEGPSRIGRFYTASFNEKATLRHHLAAWRGRDFTPAELKGFDLFNILGKSCLINVTHKTTDTKVYANIQAIMALPKAPRVPIRKVHSSCTPTRATRRRSSWCRNGCSRRSRRRSIRCHRRRYRRPRPGRTISRTMKFPSEVTPMTIQILTCEQRTPEWFAARAGRVTGSRAADVMARIKSGEAAARRDYRLQLAVERITGKPMEDGGFVTNEMQRGIDLEPKARETFATRSGIEVRETGFVIREDMPIGCSTDGDMGNFEAILEIKCPKSATHVEYLKADRLPPRYVWQVTHNVFCTHAKAAHFVSYDDRLPAHLDYFALKIERCDLPVTEYAFELKQFLGEVEAEYQELLKLKAV